jgi:oxygen-independent coproporphyrinogen-3 oxidase
MPSALPDGDPVPDVGPLGDRPPRDATRTLGVYVHVPFCASRCGYCDFNTYTADELGPGAARSGYAATAILEIDRAHAHLGVGAGPVSTVFVGGGTPTLLPADDLVRILEAITDRFGLVDGAEVTTEANPESVDPTALERLVAGGFTRISFGMQSQDPRVLAVLDRTHTPGRTAAAVAEARAAGFTGVNVDLIYGTPGESDESWRSTIEAALAMEPDHVSAYALIVEDGTALAARVRRGELPAPDDDVLADRYESVDAALRGAGLEGYEVSNWARPGHACAHNLGYWRSDDWWGVGPGAHSHVDGVRWWNVKHPAAYAAALADGRWPAAARELLAPGQRRAEDILLRIRLAEGLPVDDALDAAARTLAADGLLEPARLAAGSAVLTAGGRLLADAVARRLVDAAEAAAPD